MTVELSQTDKAAIGALDRSDIEVTTAGLKQFLKRSTWIGSTNYYAPDVVARLKKELPTTPQRKRNLAQYIAASVTLHANDGWSYLGRAIGCLLVGDSHRALHLAYYAELRAAMSLLASAGIGIFSTQHFLVSAANSTSKLRLTTGTHLMAWLSLEEWAQSAASGDVFADLIRPDSRPLDDWFQQQGGATTLAPQAKAWFMQWGMDLSLGLKDRDARNESSYRPDGMPTTWDICAKDSLSFVRDMWSTLEPSATSSFDQIDRHILRLATERYYFGKTGKKPTANDRSFVALVNDVLAAQNLPSVTETRLREFLLRQSAPSDPLIFKYSAVKPGAPETDAFAVISRAVLLLRLATGSANRVLNSVGFDASFLSFWWKGLGETRGLWEPGSPPTVLGDLWADIEDSLKDVSDIENQNPNSLDSCKAMARQIPGQLDVFASHERVALWGLFPS